MICRVICKVLVRSKLFTHHDTCFYWACTTFHSPKSTYHKNNNNISKTRSHST